MKTRNVQSSLLAIAAVTVLAITVGNVAAQDSTTAPIQPAVASQPALQLSYGVPQVLQLVQAKVSDSIIVSYIQNSGTIYGLKVSEIVYLKQQGVSDDVLNAMLNQRSRMTGSTEPATATASSTTASDQTYASTTPAVTYAQTAPPSTVYVIPDTQTYRYNTYYYNSYPSYAYYPYYYGYYGAYPAISFSFGWGGGYGGYRGGYYYGGGYHGGGSWGGGWHGSSGGGGSWHGGGHH